MKKSCKSCKTTKVLKHGSSIEAHLASERLKDQGYTVNTKVTGGKIVPSYVTTATKKKRR